MSRNIFRRKKSTSDAGEGGSSRRSSEVESSSMRRGGQQERDERVSRSENDEARISNESPSIHSDDADDEGELEITVPNSRKLCRVWGRRLICDEESVDSRISRTMTQIFKKSIVENGFQWKNIPPSHVDMYFEEFKKFYRWDEDEDYVKYHFILHGRRKYSDMVNKWKKNRNRGQPLFLSEATWKNFCAYWDNADTVSKGAKMSANRRSETGGRGSGMSIHVGGSLSTRGHAKKLEKQLGREPEFFELMHATHFKKDGSGYCDPRSAQIAAEFEARKAALEEGESAGSVIMVIMV